MEFGDSQIECRDCGKTEGIHQFPCKHYYCWGCIVRFNFIILKSFKCSLENGLEVLQDKSSFLGCKLKCSESRLSMSLTRLERVIHTSELSQTEKEEFLEISELGLSFFSGIRTRFFKCEKCKKIKFCVEERPLICTKCIKEICYNQVQAEPSVIFYNYTVIKKNKEL